MNIKKILGNNIRVYRKKAQMTQELLSEELGISAKHLSKIESGQNFISSELLENLYRILNVTPSALFYSPDHDGLDNNSVSQIEGLIDTLARDLKKNIRELL
ncbi:MAG: helix-turn-helix transcriptional regulator [Candidatus Latescibacteria bacterium]|nr:helix-turn-helix transcriptional regulator [Candidatus Latescibacterota bacterium]